MSVCKSIGCGSYTFSGNDFCKECLLKHHYQKENDTTNVYLAQKPLLRNTQESTNNLANTSVDTTNPKDTVGSTKLPISLVPDTVSVLAAMSFAEGASKYGAYNWRASGVRLSIYMEAMRRHQIKLWNGEWADKKTKVPHLASIIACAGIIEDARLCNKLVDDRPPVVDMEIYIEEAESIIRHVQQLNAHMQPKHWTQNNITVPALND